MSSITFITIITALAALIGALSPIIVALIQSNIDKSRQRNVIFLPDGVELPHQKTQIHWLVVLSFAFLGGFIGYSLAKFANTNPSTAIPNIMFTPTNTSRLTPTPDGRIFFDEFTEGTTKWVNNYQTGKTEGGEFYVEDGYLLAGNNTWQNYSVRVRVRLISGDIDFGIVSRFVDYYHFYTCQFWHHQSWLVKTVDNLAQGSVDLLATNPNGLTVGNSYDIRMDVQDKVITCFLDGNVVATASDNTFTAGKFGLRVFNTQVAVDEVEVFELP